MPFSPQLTQSIQDLTPLYTRLRTNSETSSKLDAEDTRTTLSLLVHIAKEMYDAKILPVETYEAILCVVNLMPLDSEDLELEPEYGLDRVQLDPATGLPMLTPGQLFAIAHTLKLAQGAAMRDQNLERIRVLQAQLEVDSKMGLAAQRNSTGVDDEPGVLEDSDSGTST